MPEPLHISKIAFGARSVDDLRNWLESQEGEARLTTRYLPKRYEEMSGGSLYWIHEHAIIGRSPLLGFEQLESGRHAIRLEPRLVAVYPLPRRAHQGWRYLDGRDAPPNLRNGAIDRGEALPPKLAVELAKLGLV